MDISVFEPTALVFAGAGLAWWVMSKLPKKGGGVVVHPATEQGVFVAQVAGNPLDKALTVTYGRGEDRKKVCMHIPDHLLDSHLRSIPVNVVITELPQGWLEFLLERPEAKF